MKDRLITVDALYGYTELITQEYLCGDKLYFTSYTIKYDKDDKIVDVTKPVTSCTVIKERL